MKDDTANICMYCNNSSCLIIKALYERNYEDHFPEVSGCDDYHDYRTEETKIQTP